MQLLHLILEYLKIGILAFGGGMSTIPFLFDLSNKYPNWFSYNDIANMLSISEGTPGPIGINMSTYTGFKVAGILGAFSSTFGLIFPSFVVLYILSYYLKFAENKIVKRIFYGLKISILVMFIIAFYNILKITFYHGEFTNFISLNNGKFNIKEIVLFVLCFLVTNIFKKIHPAILIILFGVLAVFVL